MNNSCQFEAGTDGPGEQAQPAETLCPILNVSRPIGRISTTIFLPGKCSMDAKRKKNGPVVFPSRLEKPQTIPKVFLLQGKAFCLQNGLFLQQKFCGGDEIREVKSNFNFARGTRDLAGWVKRC
jgi:hypothetical protein